MPAELLLLLIVAFASPSCQVLSSLRMGEALQPLPCLQRPSLSVPVPQAPGVWASGLSSPQQQGRAAPCSFFLLDPAVQSPSSVQPYVQEPRPSVSIPTPTSVPRSLGPQPLLSQDPESGPQPLCPFSCNPGRPDGVRPR